MGQNKKEEAIRLYKEEKYLDAFVLFKQLTQDQETRGYLSNLYMNMYGEGTQEDYEKAYQIASEALEEELSPYYLHLRALGNMYRLGLGVSCDFNKALECYEQAGIVGDDISWREIGHMYYHGIGVAVHKKKAFECYTNSQIIRSIDLLKLVEIENEFEYRNERYDKEKLIEEIDHRAENQEGEALGVKGALYEKGIYYEQDNEKALDYYMQGARRGCSYSMLAIINGDYSTSDKKSYYGFMQSNLEQRVAKNDATALFAQGMYCIINESSENGEILNAVYNSFLCAAEKGNEQAMFMLGCLYEEGITGEPDQHQASFWFKKAMTYGSGMAYCKVGKLYMEEDNEESLEALMFFYEAAKRGVAHAYTCLGIAYQEGKIVEQNIIKAKEYYITAQDMGDAEALKRLGLISRRWYRVRKEHT